MIRDTAGNPRPDLQAELRRIMDLDEAEREEDGSVFRGLVTGVLASTLFYVALFALYVAL